jgi:hypothetical protein
MLGGQLLPKGALKEYDLDNGMHVILLCGAPVVITSVMYLWC